MDDSARLAHIRDEVEARLKGMAPALPAEVAEAAAQDQAALDAQEELEAESPEAAQARAEAEAERAQERFQDSFFETLSSADYASRQEAVDSMYEDEFVSELESGEEGSRVRSRGATEAEAAELESGKKIRVYRAMQLIDGKLYPPMAAVVDGALVEPTELGKWYVADERPDLAYESGRFKLDEGNGSSIKAAYNPYWHTSRSPLNDQFSSAWKRTNLVTVECEVPASELTSGYKAEKAKDAVGEMDWHSGPVSSMLAKVGLKRKVILSRYCKVLRVIPDAEVADAVSRMLKGKGISIPADVITPSLRKELLARGVKVTPTKNVADVFAWKQLDRKVDESTRMEFQADPFTRDWTVWSEPDYIAALPVHMLPQMEPISDRTDNNSVEKALQSLFDRFGEVTNEDTEEKVVFNRGEDDDAERRRHAHVRPSSEVLVREGRACVDGTGTRDGQAQVPRSRGTVPPVRREVRRLHGCRTRHRRRGFRPVHGPHHKHRTARRSRGVGQRYLRHTKAEGRPPTRAGSEARWYRRSRPSRQETSKIPRERQE